MQPRHGSHRYVKAFYDEAVALLKACKSNEAKILKFETSEIKKSDDGPETSMDEVEKHADYATSLRDDMASLRGKIASMTSISKLCQPKDKKDKEKDTDGNEKDE